MAFPQVAASLVTGHTGTNSTSSVFNIPAHNNGDLILLIIGSDGDNTLNSLTALNGASWTVLFTAGTVRTAVSLHFAYVRAIANQASQTTTTCQWTDNEQYVCHAYVLTGVHSTSNPQEAHLDNGPGTAPDPPPLSPTWGAEDTLWFAGASQDDGGAGVSLNTAPANYTNALINNPQTGAAVSLLSSRRELNAGTENPGVIARTGSATNWPYTIAIRPSAGAAPSGYGQVSWAKFTAPVVSAVIAVGVATETDAAQALTVVQGNLLTIGVTTETDAAQAVTAQLATTVAVGVATETGAAQALTVAQSNVVTVGVATEADAAAGPVSASYVLDLTLGAETDEALSFGTGTGLFIAVGEATETDAAQVVTPAQPVTIAVGEATETDAAQTLTAQLTTTVAVGEATETDAAQTLTAQLATTVAVGEATEADEAQTFGSGTGLFIPLATVVEASAGQVITPALVFAAVAAPASEVDASLLLIAAQVAPQFARPVAPDAFVGAWTNEVGASTNLFESINEVVASDLDFVRSPNQPALSPYVCSLDALPDPGSSTGHVLRYRFDKENVAGDPSIDLTVELRQGYISEASPGTSIASVTHSGISDAHSDQALVLSSAQADAITDYSDLYVRFVADQSG